MAADNEDVVLHQIDRTQEYEQFIEELRDYHIDRGTVFEAEPKIGAVALDLLKIFKHIVKNGGYDKVSEEKLAWRRMANELGIFANKESTTGFYLKEKFYKNLAAYEISTVHGKEPPPKEILEDVSAKGAALLTRTFENFIRAKRSSNIGGDSPAPSGESTPSREKPAVETPTSSVRASRGLREAPPQRVIFQPDTGPTRPTRQTSAQHHHQPGSQQQQQPGPGVTTPQAHQAVTVLHQANAAMGNAHNALNWRNVRGAAAENAPLVPINDTPFAHGHEPPRGSIVIPLYPVDTPANNPEGFAKRKQAIRPAPDPIRSALAGRLEGPGIYFRCLMALRSRIRAEQSYALYHLVRISHERGDIRFLAFNGLAEALVEKVLEVGALFYDVKWTISWMPADDLGDDGLAVLNGNEGTADILERIECLDPKVVNESVQPEEFADAMALVNEAALTLRNMMTSPENASWIANFYPLCDMICILLKLPASETVVELKNYALDMAEQLTPYITLDGEDPLYRMLVAQLDSQDRGVILTSLHALARISVNLEAANRLEGLSGEVLGRIAQWMLLNDDELLDACLDLLYQYTAVIQNVDNMLRSISTEHLVSHLVRLLSHGARRTYREVVLEPERRLPAKDEIPQLPADRLEELLRLNEPARVHAWIKCLFEEDDQSFVTQIAAWKAYQSTFSQALKAAGQVQIEPAKFIQSSVQVYEGSQAQVTKDETGQQKFIVRGIRVRANPVSPSSGREYQRCLWSTNDNNPNEKCGHYYQSSETMWRHIIEDHLGERKGPDGVYTNRETDCACRWGICGRYPHPSHIKLGVLAMHIKIHTGDLWPQQVTADAQAKPPKKSWIIPAKTIKIWSEETATVRDERTPNTPPQAAGIPLSAALVLRNIARNVGKTEAEEELLKEHEATTGKIGGWNERLFRLLVPRLMEILTENKALSPYIQSLLDYVYQDPELESGVRDRFPPEDDF